MLLLAQLVIATLLVVEGPRGGVLDNHQGLQVSRVSSQLTQDSGDWDCGAYDEKKGTCFLNDQPQRDARFKASCNNQGQVYQFSAPYVAGECFCFKCQ